MVVNVYWYRGNIIARESYLKFHKALRFRYLTSVLFRTEIAKAQPSTKNFSYPAQDSAPLRLEHRE